MPCLAQPVRRMQGLERHTGKLVRAVTDVWPSNVRRQAMLDEAIGLIRLLWRGGTQTFEGRFFAVDRARIYSLPPHPPPIYLAVFGREAAQLAGRIGDGLLCIGFVTLGWCGPGERSEGPRLDVAVVLLGLAAPIWVSRSRELPRPTSAILPSSSAAPAATPTSATSP